jgi:hypothetical protein
MATTDVTNNRMGNATVMAITMQGRKRSAINTMISSEISKVRERDTMILLMQIAQAISFLNTMRLQFGVLPQIGMVCTKCNLHLYWAGWRKQKSIVPLSVETAE